MMTSMMLNKLVVFSHHPQQMFTGCHCHMSLSVVFSLSLQLILFVAVLQFLFCIVSHLHSFLLRLSLSSHISSTPSVSPTYTISNLQHDLLCDDRLYQSYLEQQHDVIL